MTTLSKFLVLLALFLSASHANAFTSLSLVAGNQFWVNYLIQIQQSMSKPTNEPSCEPVSEPTNDQINDHTTNQTKQWLEQDALLPGILSSKWVLLWESMTDDEIQACKTQSKIPNHIKWRFHFPSLLSILRVLDWYLAGFTLIGRQLPTCSMHSILFRVNIPRLKSWIAEVMCIHKH